MTPVAHRPAASFSLERRHLLGAALGLGVLQGGSGQAATARAPRLLPSQTTWTPVPPPAPAREGVAELGDARLWYWDTGGAGDPVVLLHPGTGSGRIWGYQQPVFARAGYRVIGYSRRGYYRSDPGPTERPGSGAGDFAALLNHLGVGKAHLIGAAAGGGVACEYALSHPDRVRSMILACSLGGASDPAFTALTRALTPEPWMRMPASFRELGPSYRAAYPAGAAVWEALEKAETNTGRVRQGTSREVSWAALATLTMPTLLIGGDADLYMPPSQIRNFAQHLPNSEAVIIAECGHSAHWEQPIAFNRTVLDFLRRRR